MKKILFLAIAIVMSVGAWAQEVIAYTQDFVDVATIKTATASSTWFKTHEKGGVYDFSGSNFIGGAANAAVDAAFKSNKIVTVAAWVYGIPGTDGCIFSNGDQSTGWKFMMTGKTFKATTKGKWDYGTAAATTQIAADQWNLIAFAVPGAASTNTSIRYYASTTNGQLWTKNEVNAARKMATPANNKCAIGNGNQGDARETYNGTIGDLVVITSDNLLTNSQIAALIGDAPTDTPPTPVGPTEEDIQALQEKIDPLMFNYGKVGYPDVETVLNYTSNFEGVTESNYAEALAAYNAYMSPSAAIKMPEEGKAYNLIFRIPNGDKYYMYRGNDGKLHGSKTEPVGNAAKFVASNVSGNTLQFTVENEYVQWFCTESNKCFGSNINGLSASANAASTLTLERASTSLVSGGNIEGITNDELLGNIRIKGAGQSGTYYFIYRTDDAFISSVNNDIYYDDNWDDGRSGLWRSSFFELKETELIVKNAWTDLEETLALADEYIVGEGYGEYTLAEGDWATTIANAEAELTAHTTEANAEALNTTITGYIDALTLNLPAAGSFVTLKNVHGTYLNGAAATAGVAARVEEPSVFYYDAEGHLIGYPGGYALNNGPAALLGASTATYEFVKGSAKGQLAVKNNSNKYLMDWSDGRLDMYETIESTCNFTIGKGNALPVAFNENGQGYATLYAPVALEIPTGVKAYTLREGEDEYLDIVEVNDVIAANTAVVLEGTANTTENFAVTTGGTADDDNVLTGTVPTIAKVEGSYVFSIVSDHEGFYQFGGDNLAGFKAYYKPEVAGVQGFVINFGGISTGINAVQQAKGQKASFDLQGRRVKANAKGLTIQNGVKVIR